MDSDDEEILQGEAKRRATGSVYHMKRYKGDFPTRLYEREETQLVERRVLYGDVPEDDWNPIADPSAPQGFTYRFMRFYHTFRGFHTGSLDLAGRHKPRYMSILRRWSHFCQDIKTLFKHSTESTEILRRPSGQPILAWDGGSFTVPAFSVNPPEIAKSFEEKWQMRVTSKGPLQNVLADIHALLTQSRRPKFQTRNLLDLPPEILYQCIEAAALRDMRSLSAACRRLRLLASPYVFKHRSFTMDVRPTYPDTDSVEDIQRYFRGLAAAAQHKVMENMAFVLSREDVAAQVESLHVVTWADMWFGPTGWRRTDEDAIDLMMPISHRLVDVVACMPNLRRVKICCFLVTEELFQRVFTLTDLSHIELLSCEVVGQPNPTPLPSASLPNLTLWVSDEAETSVWEILPPLINLRWLSLRSHSTNGPQRILPPPWTVQRWNPFATLEKAYIADLCPFEWEDLVMILEDASVQVQRKLPLTHLKLSFTYGVPDFIVDSLLHALEGSTLQFLIIDGIRDVTPDLISRIAHVLPNLHSLTLYNRGNDSERECKATNWPFPTWEYARQLAQFKSLAHFGWNLVTKVIDRPSPAIIRRFEGDFPDVWDSLLDEELEELTPVAKLFASHCSSLTSLGTYGCFTCRIHRSLSGQTIVDMISSFQAPDDGVIHDPNDMICAWPIVRPLAKECTF